MTDSSSEDNLEMAMAQELMQSKMELAQSKYTHLLRVGTFQMEVAPTENVDVRAFFNEVLDKLMDKYGDKLLQIDVTTGSNGGGGMHG
tara:strand:- start:299 stop:562 length:264 start_codon:yes stop_codon:yes gene_type:complete